jgi:hypothetical protein
LFTELVGEREVILVRRRKYKVPVVGKNMAPDSFEELKESIWSHPE